MEKKTPLYDNHVALGGKIVPFGGYLLPVQYETGVIKEHMAVRTEAGLFDVSHMGELMLTGPDALKNVQKVTTNDMSGMYDGQVRYSPMCNEQGGVVDDILVYKVHDEAYLLVVNASNKDKDAAWIAGHVSGDVKFEDISESVAQVALQGPNAVPILAALAADEQIPKKYYSFVKEADVKGIKCLISRTGYTGELGYELYCAAEDGPKLWNLLLETGKEFDMIPCGLGARDTLRLEAAMPLYGHEMDDTGATNSTDKIVEDLSTQIELLDDSDSASNLINGDLARVALGQVNILDLISSWNSAYKNKNKSYINKINCILNIKYNSIMYIKVMMFLCYSFFKKSFVIYN